MNDPRAEYDRRIAHWSASIARDARVDRLVSNLRLLTAAAAAILVGFVIRGRFGASWLLLPALAFLALIVAHARVLRQMERGRLARGLYERGTDRLAGQWAGQGRDGISFAGDHAYARDLDLFGRGSLFELLNSAHTEVGEETLAAWLRRGAAVGEVRERQVAVAELCPMLDFREDVAVLAADAEAVRTAALVAWARSKPIAIPSVVPWIFVGCATVTILLTALAYTDKIPWSFVVLWLLIETAVAFVWRRPLRRVVSSIETPERDLGFLAGLLARIEREPFSAVALVGRRQALTTDGVLASRAIRRLRQLVSLFESSTHNLLFVPLTRALLLPELLAVAMVRWHETYGSSVAEWVRIAGEFEALASLGAYAYERPADPFPVLVDEGVVFDGTALGHPLIQDAVSVRNDVRIGGNAPHVLVISGSNMSGKSTLLRAVGLNVVLALAGAPIRASRLQLSSLALGATLRIDDSLQDGRSRFYAEILRIRTIVLTVSGGIPVLFLLDEILQGTNSSDRRIGAEAIVRGLVTRGAIGLITTHDLALTELVTPLGSVAANMHFEDRIEDGKSLSTLMEGAKDAHGSKPRLWGGGPGRGVGGNNAKNPPPNEGAPRPPPQHRGAVRVVRLPTP